MKCLFLFVCLFVVYRLTRTFFTHTEMSPLLVKDCKFSPMLSTHGHCAVRVLQRAITTVTQGIRLYWSSPSTRDTFTYYRACSSEAVTSCFYDLGLSRLLFERPTFPLAGPTLQPNKLRQRRGPLSGKRAKMYKNIFNFFCLKFIVRLENYSLIWRR